MLSMSARCPTTQSACGSTTAGFRNGSQVRPILHGCVPLVHLDKSKLNIAVTWGQACNDLEAEYHREQDLLESKLN